MLKREKKDPNLQTIQIGNDVIVVKRTQVAQYFQNYSNAPPKLQSPERSKYEVLVNGELRGWLVFPTGWGQTWRFYCTRYKAYVDHPDPDDIFGMQGSYRPVSISEIIYGHGHRSWKSRDEIIQHVIPALQKGLLPTEAEYAEEREAEKVKKIADEAERKKKEAKWKREREEQERREEEERSETEMGLQSIHDKYFGQLTNLEQAALTRALEQWKK